MERPYRDKTKRNATTGTFHAGTEGPFLMSVTQTAASAPSGTYDNNGQYTRKGILRYEKIFGDGYISTGGPETTEYLSPSSVPRCEPEPRCLMWAAASAARRSIWRSSSARS